MLSACQRRHQHNQGRLGQMEVRDQCIDYLELVTRIDEDICPATLLGKGAILCRCRLKCSRRRRSNSDDSVSGRLGRIDHVRRFLRHLVILGMHVMLEDILHLHRTESAKSHMKGHFCDIHSHITNLL